MSNINIESVSYPKSGSTTQVAINSFDLSNVIIDLQDKIITDVNNLNFDIAFSYIDYSIPGNKFIPTQTSLTITNNIPDVPYAFSDIISLCKLQVNVLSQLFYIPNVWENSVVYSLNTIVSYIPASTYAFTYAYMSLLDNTIKKTSGKDPSLYTNYWQLQEYSTLGMVPINDPYSEPIPYPTGYLVYYNYVYYDYNVTPSKRGIYSCNTPTWLSGTYDIGALVYYPSQSTTLYISLVDGNTTEPEIESNTYWEIILDNPQPPIILNDLKQPIFNTTYWLLQSWNSTVTYAKNYIVYYTPTGGSQTLYISLTDDNNINKIPSTVGSTYWAETSL